MDLPGHREAFLMEDETMDVQGKGKGSAVKD